MKTLARSCVPLLAALAATFLGLGCDGGSAGGPGARGGAGPAAPAEANHTITGKVLLDGRDRHSGILVFLGGTSISCLTDSDGAYTLHNVPPGSYELLAEKSGFEDALVDRVNLPAGESKTFRMASATLKASAGAAESQPASAPAAAAERAASLSGRATLKDAEKHGGILVRILETGNAVETDNNGEYYFAKVEPGAYRLEFLKDGYARAEQPINIKREADNRADPVELAAREELQANRVISGQVYMFGADRNPRADFDLVTVRVEGLNKTAKLAPDGTFQFEGLPPSLLTVSAEANGYDLEHPVQVDLQFVDSAKVALYLIEAEKPQPVGSVTGRALRDGSQGSQSGIAVALAGTPFSTLTAPNGGFTFDKVPVGTYQAVAQAEGYETFEMDGVEVTEGQTVDVGELRLKRSIEPPRVVKTQPADGATDVHVVDRVPVIVQFSKPMQGESVKSAFKITPEVDYQIFFGNESPESSDRLLYVELLGTSPRRYVKFDAPYQVAISKSAVDLDGIAMAKDYTFKFRTAGPEVVGSYPQDGSRSAGIDPMTPVTFYLNDQLKPRSLTPRSVSIRPSLSANPKLDYVSDSHSGWTSVQVYGDFRPDTLYTVSLASGLTNVDDKKFGNTPFTITFRTAAWRPLVPLDSGQERIRPMRP
ncbi:MAG: carboxypeptidase regulatory-like domain-containing protein [Candidatus Sumerlaeota bacterium]|nr:carboxypeptidase regulatory-like domain-containing protein [Candidatus Sumerlaeota bacterium]